MCPPGMCYTKIYNIHLDKIRVMRLFVLPTSEQKCLLKILSSVTRNSPMNSDDKDPKSSCDHSKSKGIPTECKGKCQIQKMVFNLIS